MTHGCQDLRRPERLQKQLTAGMYGECMTKKYSGNSTENDTDRLDSFTMYVAYTIFMVFGVVILAVSIIGIYALLLWMIGG